MRRDGERGIILIAVLLAAQRVDPFGQWHGFGGAAHHPQTGCQASHRLLGDRVAFAQELQARLGCIAA